MEKVNVLVGWGLPSSLMERIAALDPRVNLLNDPDEKLPRPPYGPPFPFPDQLLPLVPQVNVLFSSRAPSNLTRRAPHLKWIQLLSAGADIIMRDDLAKSNIIFTTAVGVHPIQISEWVIGAMISLVKRFPEAVRAQERKEYWQFVPGEVAGRTAGILGMGAIGQRVAHLCKVLGMRVIATRRSIKAPLEQQEGADLLLPPSELPRILKESDFLIICLPRTQETQGLIGVKEIQQMKRGIYLINVGRGGIVDEAALVQAIQSGHLSGAALDVFAKEPLPPDSPLWDEPRVLLTAHVAGNTPHYEERATELFMENLRRFLDGQELLNVYDPERGY